MRDLHDGTVPGFRYCNSEFCVNRCRAATARDADLNAVSLNITGITVITVIAHQVVVRAAEYLHAVDLEMCAEIRLDGRTGRRAALGTATRPATASASVDAAVASTRCVWPGPPLQLKQRNSHRLILSLCPFSPGSFAHFGCDRIYRRPTNAVIFLPTFLPAPIAPIRPSCLLRIPFSKSSPTYSPC